MRDWLNAKARREKEAQGSLLPPCDSAILFLSAFQGERFVLLVSAALASWPVPAYC